MSVIEALAKLQHPDLKIEIEAEQIRRKQCKLSWLDKLEECLG